MAKISGPKKCDICSAYTYTPMINPQPLPCGHMCCVHARDNMIQELNSERLKRNNLECPDCNAAFTIPLGSLPLRTSDMLPCIREKYREKIERTTGQSPIQLGGKIMGMAILNDALFVCCRHKPNVILKYDLDKLDCNISPTEIQVPGVVWPRGMAVNDNLCCLYFTDWEKIFGGRLWRLEYRKNGNCTPAKDVAHLDQQPFGVSYASMNNQVLVTCATPVNVFRKGGSIYIFQDLGETFEKLKVVEMPDAEIPRHTILTFSSRYVTCHGWTFTSHGVTSFERGEHDDIIRKEFNGGGGGEQLMNRPLSMTLDADGLILVVDYGNSRIELLTENLILVRHLITATEHNVSKPRHVCLHPSSGRMFIGQEDGCIHIFDAFISST